MYNQSSSQTITNVTFSGNTASLDGGGMYNDRNSAPTVVNSTFSGNSATKNGGGMYNNMYSVPTVMNSTFSYNRAWDGGGMYNDMYSVPTVMNSTFSDNSAEYAGGIENDTESNPKLVNVTFSGNSAKYGGGMSNVYADALLLNVTFSGNSATGNGGGIYNYFSNPMIANSLFWNNIGSGIANIRSTPVVHNSVVQGGYPDGTNIITDEPKLGTLGNYGGFTPTIPLLAGSSAINAGYTCPATDQRVKSRVGACDIGAYEYDYTGVYYVKPSASGSGNCQSWDNACTLQTALSSVSSGDEIWAMVGTYKPVTPAGATPTDQERLISFQLKSDVAVYGGFAGTETTLSQRNPAANVTTLSGDIGTPDDNSDNSYHVVTADGITDAILDGFTISGGNANGAAAPKNKGGGMYNYGSSPTVTNVIFSGNKASFDGGGMYIDNVSSPTVTNVIFSDNSALYGGGMYNNGNSNPTVSNVTFSANTADDSGGGMFNNGSHPTVTNVTFSANKATRGSGGGMSNNWSSNVTIRNAIFWGNTPATQIYNDSSTTVVSDSVVQNGYADGTNIITADPLLGTLGNYGGFTPTIPLLRFSSAIHAGNAIYCTSGKDQRGVSYVGPCDIGAYEFDYAGFSTLYVKESAVGAGDCLDWENACTLQTALKVAISGKEIWVAAGVHKAGTYYTHTFQLVSGVAVYGGFSGTETSRDQRDPAAHVTILSGDIDNNDVNEDGNYIDETYHDIVGNNSRHVVTGATGATLEGFTITGGNAKYGAPSTAGGGMYNSESSPTVTNVIFSGNSATYVGGGGMYNSGGSPIITNVTFSGNSTLKYGGGMYNNSSNPTLINVTFSGNSAKADGGGMYNRYSSPTVTDSAFSGNSATNGGGMYNDQANPTVANVTFNKNLVASYGAGMYNGNNSNPTITNVTFANNRSNWEGGGIANYFSGSAAITNATFSGNYARNGGGGILNLNSAAVLKNVTFTGNTSDNRGGGLYNYGSPDVKVYNSILWGNSAPNGGQVLNINNGIAISDSVVEAGCPNGAGLPVSTCTNIIVENPLLDVLGNYGGLTQTIPLLSGSPAVDAGNDSDCPSSDQRGVTRPQGTYCDIGAMEIIAFHAISGNVSLSGVGMEGVAITYGQSSTSTDINGDYSFSVYDGWSGNVTPVKAGYVFTSASQSYSNVITDQTGQDYAAANGYVISGTVRETGVTITYTGGSTTSMEDGSYQFTIPLTGWSGTVSPSKAGYVFIPSHKDYTSVTGDLPDQDYNFAIPSYPPLQLTIDKIGNGTVTADPDVPFYTYGDMVQVTAVADVGWTLTSWEGACTGTAPCLIVMDNNKSVTAHFTFNIYTLAYMAGEHGSITGDPLQMVDHGTNGTEVTAIPDSGYHFVSWSDGVLTTSRTDTNVTDDIDVTANFAINTYTLTYTAGEHGSITGTSPQTVNYGADGTEVTAMPDTSYHFVNWSDGVLTASRTDNNVTGNINVTANFALDEYMLTVTSDHGTVTKTPNQTTYHYGDVVTLSATSEPGWTFTVWTPSLTDNQVTITGDTTVTANYTQEEYTLTVNSDHGAVTKTPDQPTYQYGAVVTLSITPDAGWTFSGWTPALMDNQVTIIGNTIITANFVQDAYTLTVNSAHGTVTKSPDQSTYHYGDVVTLSVTPDPGWIFTDWTPALINNQVTITGNTTVTANYNGLPTDLTLSASSVTENLPAGTTVGTLSTVDPNAGDTHTYSLACSTPGVDDASFTIVGNALNTAAVFDYETKNAYNICIRTDDGHGGTFDKEFTITVNNLPEPISIILRSTGAQDGWVLESGETTLRGGTMDATATTLRLGDDTAKKQYRSVLSFATGAALPDSAVIIKVTLKVRRQGIVGGGNPVGLFKGFLVDIRRGTFGTSALQITDWQARANKAYGPFNTVAAGGWYTIDLTAAKAYINKLDTYSGLTQFRLGFNLDDNNNAIANYLSIFSGDAGAASRPQLIIEYYVP